MLFNWIHKEQHTAVHDFSCSLVRCMSTWKRKRQKLRSANVFIGSSAKTTWRRASLLLMLIFTTTAAFQSTSVIPTCLTPMFAGRCTRQLLFYKHESLSLPCQATDVNLQACRCQCLFLSFFLSSF